MNEDGVTEGTVVQTQDSVHQMLSSLDLTCVEYVMTYILGGKQLCLKVFLSFYVLDEEGKNTTKNLNKSATF